jgi:hypothetical protein
MAEHPTPDHPGDAENEAHGVGDHGDDGGHADHGHGSDALGPIDIERWGAFVVGIGLGLVVALCIAVAIGGAAA